MIKECLSCERAFDPSKALEDGVLPQYAQQYCSKKCEDVFEQYLKDHALTETEAAAHIPGHAVGAVSEVNMNKLIQHFSTRIKEK